MMDKEEEGTAAALDVEKSRLRVTNEKSGIDGLRIFEYKRSLCSLALLLYCLILRKSASCCCAAVKL